MKNETVKTTQKWLVWSSIYALIFLALVGYLNFVTPYSAEPTVNPSFWQIVVWGLLYVPVLALSLVAKRNVVDFGFTLSPQLALAFVLVSMLCAFFSKGSGTSWLGACIEAIARTGEEIFFRGFLFDIFYQLLSNRRWPWLWAAIASSVIFASIHTQTFQQSFLNENGYPATPAIFIIFQRLINVFGLALVFASLRVVTRSILPGAIAHSIANGGIFVVPFVLVIYFLAILWAHARRERIVFGIPAQTA